MQAITIQGITRFLKASHVQKVSLLAEFKRQIVSERRARKWRSVAESNEIFVLSEVENKEEYFLPVTSDSLYEQLYIHGEAEFQKVELALSLLGWKSCAVFVDVGANIGHTTIPGLCRKRFEFAYAIEPDPVNFGLCAINAELNRVSERIHLVHAAATNVSTSNLTLLLSRDEFGDHQVASANRGEQDRREIQVPSCTLDEIVDLPRPSSSLIWIDVQGFEVSVLRGAKSHLAQRVPVCLELWPSGIARHGDSLSDLMDLLSPYAQWVNLDRPMSGFKSTAELPLLWDQLRTGDYGRTFVDVLIV